MRRLLILFAAMVIATFGTFTNARAALLDAPVPGNAYISLNGLDWAWASPCSGPNCGNGFGLDLSFQGALGWYIPSAAELALAPLATDFVFAGANVPLGGVDPVSSARVAAGNPLGDIAIAVPYFNTLYTHADYCNAPGSDGVGCVGVFPWNTLGAYQGFDYSEFLVVRQVVQQIPEPATLLLLGSGLAGLGLWGRKRLKANS